MKVEKKGLQVFFTLGKKPEERRMGGEENEEDE